MFRNPVSIGLANFFGGRVPKLFINLEEILWRVHRSFEVQNNVLVSSVIIINSFIIINAHYNYVV